MLIHGKERGFKLTIGASKKISIICPDKDIKNIGKLFSESNTARMIDLVAFICSGLSEGYEMEKKFTTPGYEPDILSEEEIMSLGINEISALQDEMMDVLERDLHTEIETEPVPTKGKKTGKKANK